MKKKRHFSFILFLYALLILVLKTGAQPVSEKGTLSVYFMDEKVGYEEYFWEKSREGYLLTVRGRISKPIPMETERLLISLDRSYIPVRYEFKGSIASVEQEILSTLREGDVEGVVRVSGHEHGLSAKVKRDAFLLPTAVFSPYMILTKKLRCSLQEEVEFSAYVIPQMEVPLLCSPVEESPCLITAQINSVVIEIGTDENGGLISLNVPSQNLRVLKTD